MFPADEQHFVDFPYTRGDSGELIFLENIYIISARNELIKVYTAYMANK